MKKKFNFTNLFNILSTILVVCFLVKTIIDYTQYSSITNSAPFYAWILVNALYFIVPSIVLFIVGIAFKNRTNN